METKIGPDWTKRLKEGYAGATRSTTWQNWASAGFMHRFIVSHQGQFTRATPRDISVWMVMTPKQSVVLQPHR